MGAAGPLGMRTGLRAVGCSQKPFLRAEPLLSTEPAHRWLVACCRGSWESALGSLSQESGCFLGLGLEEASLDPVSTQGPACLLRVPLEAMGLGPLPARVPGGKLSDP